MKTKKMRCILIGIDWCVLIATDKNHRSGKTKQKTSAKWTIDWIVLWKEIYISHLLQSTTLRRPLALEANSKLKNLFVRNQFLSDRGRMRMTRGSREKKATDVRTTHTTTHMQRIQRYGQRLCAYCRHIIRYILIECQPRCSVWNTQRLREMKR